MGAQEFVAAARAMKGARWRHRGRKPWAVDCIGLLAVAGAKAGLVADDVTGYGREPWDDRLSKGCRERWGEPIPRDQAQPGDIATFRWGAGEPSHIGLLGDHPDGGLTLIHAHNQLGVTEASLKGRHAANLVEIFRPVFSR